MALSEHYPGSRGETFTRPAYAPREQAVVREKTDLKIGLLQLIDEIIPQEVIDQLRLQESVYPTFLLETKNGPVEVSMDLDEQNAAYPTTVLLRGEGSSNGSIESTYSLNVYPDQRPGYIRTEERHVCKDDSGRTFEDPRSKQFPIRDKDVAEVSDILADSRFGGVLFF